MIVVISVLLKGDTTWVILEEVKEIGLLVVVVVVIVGTLSWTLINYACGNLKLQSEALFCISSVVFTAYCSFCQQSHDKLTHILLYVEVSRSSTIMLLLVRRYEQRNEVEMWKILKKRFFT